MFYEEHPNLCKETPMKSLLTGSQTRRTYRSILTTFFLCTCLVGLAQPGWSQMANGHETRGIPGYFDPRKGSFTPLRPSASATESDAAPVPTFGELVYHIQISIWSALRADATISCGG